MNDQMTVVVDADMIIAQLDNEDTHHANVLRISDFLIKQKAQILYPVTAIAEANAHIQRVLGDSVRAHRMATAFIDTDVQVIKVNHHIFQQAVKYFSPTMSKKNTLFDCIVVAIAEKHHADAIFSFDKFYQKNGFKLASELL